MSENINQIIFEKLLIQFMFTDDVVREKLAPYLDTEVFTGLNKNVVKEIKNFIELHSHFPRVDEMNLFISRTDVFEHLKEIMDYDSSNFDRDFILKELEEFYRKSLIKNAIIHTSENLNKPTSHIQDIPDKIRDALGFNFSDDLGLDFFDDTEKLFESLHDKTRKVPTGLKTIDEMTKGGIDEKTLNVAIGGTHVGKSLFLCSITTSMILANRNVLYLSLEMSEEKVAERILANILDIELDNLCMLPKEKFMQNMAKIKKMIQSKLVIIQKPAKSISANKLKQVLKELKIKKGFIPEVVCVDYMGLMIPNNAGKDSNSFAQQKDISEELRGLMVEEEKICWTGAQTNREGMKSSEVEMTDISESIGVTFTADFILGLSTNEELKAAGRYNVKILKNRYGQSGFKIFVGVDYPKMRIYDLDDCNKQTTLIDDAAVQVLSTLSNNKKEKDKKVLEIE